MTKQEFKDRWESSDDCGGITFDDIAYCAKKWGIAATPRTRPMQQIMHLVLAAEGTNDAEEYKP